MPEITNQPPSATDAPETDPAFVEEQDHLTKTHAKLEGIRETTDRELREMLKKAIADRESMLEDLSLDFGNDVNLETYVDIESMNRIMDSYNLYNDVNAERLRRAVQLLRQPYFAKISLQFKPGAPARDIYIGSAGMTDENYRHFIVDWRSPVAEVYYNQANGHTSYKANGRTIEVDLKLRRQFDIDQATLNAYFDTTVAIQDPLLLASLSKQRSDHMTAITATIQKEQNEVIRHEDVPALLVNGIAGSGKTSVLLQRIAYLFYQKRDTLDPSQVFLLTPNPVFQQYIEGVLPEMGERNPETLTWDDLMETLGLGDRGLGRDASAESLHEIDRLVDAGLTLEKNDYLDIRVDDERVVPASQVRNVRQKFSRFAPGPHLASLIIEELHERVNQRVARLCKTEEVQDSLLDLTDEEQEDIFSRHLNPQSEDEWAELARTYLEYRYAPVHEAIDDGQWLRVDRIGMRILGKQSLTSAEWLYLKMALTGVGNRHAQYVMIDEVQDYTVPQLMVLARYFYNAHFLLLGDENQAIREGTATFPQIKDVFQHAFGSVAELQLLTSYRSSPEITALFTKLMDPDQHVQVSSVQRPGHEPVIKACATDAEYESAIRAAVEDAADKDGLTAVIAADGRRVHWLGKLLQDTPLTVVGDEDALPESGVVLLSLKLAKGLEFDRVIIPDAQESVFDTDDVSRHRLYTSISRATQEVTIIAQGELTPLLK
jgi:DNA helicase-2/ATP-dependent DNA helicase PcrA